MRYGKLIDGYPSYAPNPILIDGSYIGNPPAEVYLAEGYKPVLCTDCPEQRSDGWYEAFWTETETALVQGWAFHEAADEDELSDTEAMGILLGGDGK